MVGAVVDTVVPEVEVEGFGRGEARDGGVEGFAGRDGELAGECGVDFVREEVGVNVNGGDGTGGGWVCQTSRLGGDGRSVRRGG